MLRDRPSRRKRLQTVSHTNLSNIHCRDHSIFSRLSSQFFSILSKPFRLETKAASGIPSSNPNPSNRQKTNQKSPDQHPPHPPNCNNKITMPFGRSKTAANNGIPYDNNVRYVPCGPPTYQPMPGAQPGQPMQQVQPMQAMQPVQAPTEKPKTKKKKALRGLEWCGAICQLLTCGG